jgi:hypothetical protein
MSTAPHFTLPPVSSTSLLSHPHDQHCLHDVSAATEHALLSNFFFGYVDSDWAMDIQHCCSISGTIFKLTGATIACKCCVQPIVSLSSTESDFLAASDAGKIALYLCLILDELHVPQTYATIL